MKDVLLSLHSRAQSLVPRAGSLLNLIGVGTPESGGEAFRLQSWSADAGIEHYSLKCGKYSTGTVMLDQRPSLMSSCIGGSLTKASDRTHREIATRSRPTCHRAGI